MWKMISGFLFMASILAAQTTPNTTAAPQPESSLSGSVSGVVRDAGAGKPIPNAQVAVTTTKKKNLETTTDSAGNYTLRGLEPGTYQLTAMVPEEGRIASAREQIAQCNS